MKAFVRRTVEKRKKTDRHVAMGNREKWQRKNITIADYS